MTRSIGFIGLGLMGEGMAANLVKAGFDVTVYNRTAAKTASLATQGAKVARTPAEAVAEDGVAITMVANDQALEEVALGAGGFGEKLGRHGVHLSMSTISPRTSARLAQYHRLRGATYIAAPVFGRPNAAAAGKLWICTSGPAGEKKRLAPVLQAMSQGIYDFGEEPGAANVVKLAGNFMIASSVEMMAEAFALAEKNGLSREALAEFFGSTLFSAPVFKNYAPVIAARNATEVGFLLRLGLKDVNLVREIADQAQTPMPFADVLHNRLLTAMAKGRGELDWTALALGASEDAGLGHGQD